MQGFAEFRQFPGEALDQVRAALDLVATPAQVIHQQGLDAGETQLPIFRISIFIRTKGFKRFPVSLLPLDQLAATAGYHPAGVLHRRRRHHQAHRLQVAQPLLVGQELWIALDTSFGHCYPLMGQRYTSPAGSSRWVITL
ncbi:MULTISPECIES: hypothetical protein [unclassified Synechococcus]|uniref:hypothetical protein n=1 Tax=unclassified Synechococcus TaxID=2626047 RepID=UPI0020CC31C1|nr:MULTISPECIES: hypothetical protein [unclassified Synechococcus]